MALDGTNTAKDEATIDWLKRRYDSIHNSPERSNAMTHCQEVAELVSPRKLEFVGLRTAGQKNMSKVYDPTGIHSNELLAAGLHGMATNPASKWFSLRMVASHVADQNGELVDNNEDAQVQKYLSHVEDVMWQRIYQPGTNFTTALHETYLDLGAFGTAVMYVGQRDNGGLLFETRPLSECVIAENKDGRVDTVFRKTRYTVRQLIQMSRSDGWKVSDQVKKAYEDNRMDEPVVVIHGVFPREDREYGKRDSKNMPYASVYFEHETAQKLQESGFPEFPYLVSRWSKYAGEVYGRSPAMTALPDIKMLQAMTITVIKAAQKIVDPPMWLKDDGAAGPVRTVPGGINYWRGNPHDGVMLMPVAGQALPITLDLLENIRNRIRTTFYTDVLQINTDAEMTATEVMQRTAERMRLMGPLIGRLEAELLGPMVERIFGILSRLKVLPDAPEQIQEQEFTVEYVSPIATAQKQQSASGIMQAMGSLQAFGPEIAAQIAGKNLDVDKLFRWAWDLFNCDPDLLRDDEAMQADANKEKAAQALQLAGPAADIAAKGSGAVKNIADAQASGGMDLAGLLQRMAKDPNAQKQVQGLMNQAGVQMPQQSPPPEMMNGQAGAQ